MDDRALAGLRIIDLTQFEAGTSCTQFLGWLGADVIKVESLTGDQSRNNRPEVPGLDGTYFIIFNCNKRSIAIDLKNPDGRELLLKLVREGDVVTENFAPGAMEKLGLDYPVLQEANPRIIMARIKGFGLSGPYSKYKSFDIIAQAAGGAMSVTGFPDREPVSAGGTFGDTGSGIHAAATILAAVYQRQRTGRGQLIEISMQEVVTNFIRVRYRQHYRPGATVALRLGNEASAGSVPIGLYPCAPGGPNDYVNIYVNPTIPRMWGDFARAIGRDDLLGDPRLQTPESRYQHRDEINAIVRDWTSKRSKQEAMRIIGDAGVPCGAVLDTADILEDEHLNERGFIETVNHPTRGPFRLPGCPVRMSDSPATTSPAPLLGQHTDEVLAEVLGMSESAIADLKERRVVR